MEYVGITGSWPYNLAELQTRVEDYVRRVIVQGNAIVTGGALGVDFWATEIALRYGSPKQLLVILPTSFEVYTAYMQRRATEGVIMQAQFEMLRNQLQNVQRQGSLKKLSATEVTKATYYARNSAVVQGSDRVVAFQVNQSAGTQDTIDKAEGWGKEVEVVSFTTTS